MKEIKLRECKEIIKSLGDDVKSYLLNKAKEEKLFIGIRYHKLMIYADGAKVLTVSEKDGKIIYTTEYDKNEKLEKARKISSFEELKNDFDNIISSARHIYEKKIEKICQQWIISNTNLDEENDWYYIDMEYANQGTNIGRFDMVAISKQKISGKHAVRLIELKVGKDSYSGYWIDEENNGRITSCSDEVKKNKMLKNVKRHKDIKKDPSLLFTNEDLSFGSGIVGHIIDYLRFLQNKEYYTQLKKNIISILGCYKELNINEVPNIKSENELEDNPKIIFALYTHCPEASNKDTIKNQASIGIPKLKEQLKKFLFNSKGASKYNLESALDGIRINNNDFNSDLKILLQDMQYLFTFSFINPDDSNKNSWSCIK